jgi:hypothetical protein
MKKVTERALRGSIRKWERIVAGTGVDERSDNCPLCQRFAHYNEETDTYCQTRLGEECPVGDSCCNTPYTGWCNHQFAEHDDLSPYVVRCARCTELAQAELDFLKSLLPKE